MKLVHIKWKDSTSMQGGCWHDRDDIKSMKPLTVVSVGYVVKETKKYITIASGFTPNQISGDICIPKSCIKKITHVEDGE